MIKVVDQLFQNKSRDFEIAVEKLQNFLWIQIKHCSNCKPCLVNKSYTVKENQQQEKQQ